jgi:hypothetical protein
VKITVETLIRANLDSVWDAWNNPDDIKQWNAASEDWHTTHSSVDLREGAKFSARMEAKDGSEGFDLTSPDMWRESTPDTCAAQKSGTAPVVQVDGMEAETRSVPLPLRIACER